MKRKNIYLTGFLTLFLSIGLVNKSFGQLESTRNSSGTILDLGGTATDLKKSTFSLKEVKYKSKVIGSRYLYDAWLPADIYLAGDSSMVSNVNVKIDLQMHTLEVQFEDEARVFPYYLIDHFILNNTNEVFYTQLGLDEPNIPMGFYKEIYRDNSGLYIKYSKQLKESYYNPAIDAGRKDDQLLTVSSYFAIIRGDMVELERGKSRRLKQLGQEDHLVQYVKDQNIDIRSEKGMIAILNYIDSNSQ